MELNDILIKPVVSEKSLAMATENKYVFKVHRSANKVMIKKAVKKIFGVDPAQVNIQINRKSGRRNKYRMAASPGKQWKKAIVTLKLGDTIELFEK